MAPGSCEVRTLAFSLLGLSGGMPPSFPVRSPPPPPLFSPLSFLLSLALADPNLAGLSPSQVAMPIQGSSPCFLHGRWRCVDADGAPSSPHPLTFILNDAPFSGISLCMTNRSAPLGLPILLTGHFVSDKHSIPKDHVYC